MLNKQWYIGYIFELRIIRCKRSCVLYQALAYICDSVLGTDSGNNWATMGSVHYSTHAGTISLICSGMLWLATSIDAELVNS